MQSYLEAIPQGMFIFSLFAGLGILCIAIAALLGTKTSRILNISAIGVGFIIMTFSASFAVDDNYYNVDSGKITAIGYNLMTTNDGCVQRPINTSANQCTTKQWWIKVDDGTHSGKVHVKNDPNGKYKVGQDYPQ